MNPYSPMTPVMPGIPKPIIPVTPVVPFAPKPVTPVIPVTPQPITPVVPVAPIPVQPTPTIPKPTLTPPSPIQTLNLFPLEEGISKGTIYRGVYIPYLDHQPQLPMPIDEKSRMLKEVGMNYFGVLELQFYLDVHPEDEEALRKFNEFQTAYVLAKDAYEARFGALDIESKSLKNLPFDWSTTDFPWAGGV
jgi:hypothetical protein